MSNDSGNNSGPSRDWLNALDDRGLTPLGRAAASSHMALTELLLRREADDRAGLAGGTPLHQAAYEGQEQRVGEFLVQGADVNAVDKYGETALHKAVQQGHEMAVRVLLEHGAMVNFPDLFGLTPLHWVAMNGHLSIAELLVVHAGDPNMPNAFLDGLTPLSLARIMGYDEIARVFATMRSI